MTSRLPRRTDAAIQNVVASLTRTAGRMMWLLVVPFVLSPGAFARYSLIMASAYAIGQLGVVGGPQILLREGRRPLSWAVLVTQALIVALILAVPASYAATRGPSPTTILLVGASGFVLGLRILGPARLKGLSRFGQVARIEGAGAAVLLAAAAALITVRLANATSFGSETAVVTETLSAGVVAVFAIGKTLTRRDLSAVVETKRLLPSMYRVGVLVALDLVIWNRTELFFLQRSGASAGAIAAFALTLQFTTMAVLVPGAMLESWLPSLARTLVRAPHEYRSECRRCRRRYIQVYAVCAFGAIAGTPLAVALIYRQYLPWVGLMTVLTAIRLLTGVAGFASSVMYVTWREGWLALPVVCGSLVALLSNSLLTLHWRLPGAVAAFAVTHVVVAGLTYVGYLRSSPDRNSR